MTEFNADQKHMDSSARPFARRLVRFIGRMHSRSG
jgi:hypothetical protein